MPFTINEHLSVRTIHDEVFILNRALSRVHTFNKTGSFLWKQLASCDSFDQVIDKLTDKFNIDRAQAEIDVSAFLQTLHDLKLVQSL
jgi:hypothetical protein